MTDDTPGPSNIGCMDEKPCSSSASVSSDVVEEAKKLLGAGNRHLVMGDVVSAVNVFQEACGTLAQKYGDMADECGEAFFLYGKALLELARMENTVLGNALEGVPEEEAEEGDDDDDKMNSSKIESADNLDEETRDELRVLVYDAMAEKEGGEAKGEGKKEPLEEQGVDVEEESAEASANQAEDGPKSIGPVLKAEDKVVSSEVQNGESAEADGVQQESSDLSEAEEGQPQEGADEEDDGDEEEDTGESKDSDEEVGNLQLAWEMLEVAKVIYERKESKEDKLMAAQSYLKLGEVAAESGNNSQALEDFKRCLGLQLKYLPSHSRLLAETHYQLGVTFGNTNQHLQAIEHFNSSVKVIESRMALLQEIVDKAEGPDGAVEEKREMEELIQLLPDIKEKVEDAQESQRTSALPSVVVQETLVNQGGASTSGFSETGDGSSTSAEIKVQVKPSDATCAKPASDISHLVRKKRKPEEASPVKDSDAKKDKQEATVNGSGDSATSSSRVQQEVMQVEASDVAAPPL